MSANPEVEGIVALPVPDLQPEPAAGVTPPVGEVRARRPRPAWLVPASIAAIGVIVVGALGFLTYTTTLQRDALHAQLVSTKTALVSTQAQLTAAQTDAAKKKVTSDYVALYVADEGKVLTDYETVVACGGYSECRTGAQQFLTDMQSFQSDRKAASVPSDLSDQDSSLGDALSAAIAGDQELISGMDNGDEAKFKDGADKVDAAMLTLAKAEAAMGTALK